MAKLSEAQQRVLKWLGKRWTAMPGQGAAIMLNGKRLCNVDTMQALNRLGYAERDGNGCWNATEAGRARAKELELASTRIDQENPAHVDCSIKACTSQQAHVTKRYPKSANLYSEDLKR